MIFITDKKDCCGCSACAQVCPKHCISMRDDVEGFSYPQVNSDLCVDCHLCEKVCPVLNQGEGCEPLAIFAANNPNEKIRLKSSSGGVFSMLAEQIIQRNGVVFGARYNSKWEVVHSWTETFEGIDAFRGSKYVQSRVGNTYREVESFLKAGRDVLFSGTPCQIAGLRKYLRKSYDKLLLVEVFCHGVPSSLVWREWLKHITKGKRLFEVNQRDKSTGWTSYSVLYNIEGKIFKQYAWMDDFMRGFVYDYMLRPSCYACPAKGGKSDADLTIGDFWGISKTNIPNDEKGMSLVIVHTDKGLIACQKIRQQRFEHRHSILNDSAFCQMPNKSIMSDTFWLDFKENGIRSLFKYNDNHGPSRVKLRIIYIKKIILNFLQSIFKHI